MGNLEIEPYKQIMALLRSSDLCTGALRLHYGPIFGRYAYQWVKFMKWFLTLYLFSSTLNLAHAENRWHGGTIQTVYPYGDGSFILRLDNDSAHCTNGESPKYYRVAVGQNGVNAEGADKLYAAALAAAAAGKNVSINFDDSTSSCYINRIQVVF